MAPCQDPQLEKLIDAALKHNDFQTLEELLQEEGNEHINLKCSKQFINKLDKLINRELDKGNVKHASLGLSCMHKFGKLLTFPGGQWMSGSVTQSLVKKWYERARQLWIEAGPESDESLLNLAEDFFDALMVIHETKKEGTCQVADSFLHHIGLLAADSRVNIMIQKEAIRKLNLILDTISPELKKDRKILLSAEMSIVMKNLACRILEGGDYDLQIALMEGLCRMTSRGQRRELADHWFSMEFVAVAFSRIQDSEFETDCRKFLNLVNGMQGDQRRVYSYPCLEVLLGKHELLMPMDENLEEFWIDFNLGSRSISFYFSPDKEGSQDGQWDTICVPENEVHSYTVEEARGRKLLKLMLAEALRVGPVQGSELHFHFSQSLDVLQAVTHVYGTAKNKVFVRNNRSSVVKTILQIVLDESSSQVVVPESQDSQAPVVGRDLCGIEKNGCLPLQDKQRPLQSVTPARMKVSESNTFVSSCGRGVGMSPSTSVLSAATPTPRAKVRPALEMISSVKKSPAFDIRELMMTNTTHTPCWQSQREQSEVAVEGGLTWQNTGPGPSAERFHTSVTLDRVLEKVHTEERLLDDSTDMVPDSQPVGRRTRSLLSSQEISRMRISVSEAVLQENRHLSQRFSKAHMPPPAPPLAPPPGLSSALAQDQCTQPSPSVDEQDCVLGGSGEPSHAQLHAQLTQSLEDLLRERERRSAGEQEDQGPMQGRAGLGTLTQTKERTVKSHQPTPAKRPSTATPLQVRSLAVQASVPSSERKRQASVCSSERKRQASVPSSERKRQASVCSSERKRQRKLGPVETTDCMMKFISSQYRTPVSAASVPGTGSRQATAAVNRSKVGESWTLTSMEKGSSRFSGFLKLTSGSNETAGQPECDVYSFRSDSPKSSRLKGMQSSKKSVAERSVTHLSHSVRKGQADKPPGKHVKKHLFSDSDTDNRTEISWLRESGRKNKPKIVDYSRELFAKPPPDITNESTDVPSPSPELVEEPIKPKKKKKNSHKRGKKELAVEGKRSCRPQRTSATSRNYRETSEAGSSSSQSDREEPTPRELWDRQRQRRCSASSETELTKPSTVTPLKEKQTKMNVKKKPVSLLEGQQKKPVSLLEEQREKPVSLLEEQREKPVSLLEIQKKKPVSLLEEQREKPVSLLEEQREKPVSLLEGQKKKPVSLLEGQKKKPVSLLEGQKKKPVSLLEGQKKKPVSLLEGQKKKPVSLLDKQREKPVTAEIRKKKPVTAELRKKKPVSLLEEQRETPVTAEIQTGEQKELWAARFTAFCPSPPPMEMMRSVESSVSAAVSPISPLHVSPPEDPSLLLEEPFRGIRASSFYRVETGGRVKALLPSLTPRGHTVPTLLPNPSPPLLTSTAREPSSASAPISPFPETQPDRFSASQPASLDKASPVSESPGDRSSQESAGRGKSSHDQREAAQLKQHMSGPSSVGLKRRSSYPISSASEEEEEKEEEEGKGVKTGPRVSMRPRKLFKPIQRSWQKEEEEEEAGEEDEASNLTCHPKEEESSFEEEVVIGQGAQKQSVTDSGRDVEVCSLVSSRSVSHVWEGNVEGEVDPDVPEFSAAQYMSSMCHQFNSQLQLKFQNRSRRMDVFAKQSMKTVQQHVSAISVQVHQYRSQDLEKTKAVLLEEISSLEKDDSTLKTMEKELTTYWRKQTQAFRSYQEGETRRLQRLRTAFQTSACQTVEYEERIFTSEMCQMREGMRSVQDELFKDMLKEELQSVRRGLQALFLPEEPEF